VFIGGEYGLVVARAWQFGVERQVVRTCNAYYIVEGLPAGTERTRRAGKGRRGVKWSRFRLILEIRG